jgi:molecular chaperone GrpE
MPMRQAGAVSRLHAMQTGAGEPHPWNDTWSDMNEKTELENGEQGVGAPEGSEESVAPGGTGDEGAGGTPDRAVVAEVDELRDELQTLNDQHLRLAAEFDNYRKRNERDRQMLATRLQKDLVARLLDVLDDLQRVAHSSPETDTDGLLEGVELVEKKFVSILESAGLEPIDAEGQRFDPEIMEALMMVPTDDPAKDDHVADVFQRGYRFRETLVRPARVRVWQHDGSGAGD